MVSVAHDKVATSADGLWAQARQLLQALHQASDTLAASADVPEAVVGVVQHLVQVTGALTPEQLQGRDPYLVEALLTGTVACAGALWLAEPAERRKQLRLALERARQALRDLVAERNVAADQPAKQIARWLAEVTGLSQHELAALVGVGTRTFQRWLAEQGAAPGGDDELRLRTLARVVDQLRWSMTAAGVVRWLQRPHPDLGGQAPLTLLGDPAAHRHLPELAAATRATVAG